MNWNCLSTIVGYFTGPELPKPEITGSYSAFSSIIIPAKLGYPPQELRLSLSFDSRDSSIFTGIACPEADGVCYIPRLSDTFFRGDDSTSSDLLSVGDQEFAGFEFELREVIDARSVAFKESLGFIGVGRGSPLMDGRSLVVQDNAGDELKIGIIDSETYKGLRFPSTWTDGNWEVRAPVKLNAVDISLTFSYNPSENNIVLPRAMEAHVRRALGPSVRITQTLTVFASCFSIPMEVSVGSVTVPISTLRPYGVSFSVIHDSDENLCKTRIRFSDTQTVVIGRLLTRAVDRVILNGDDGSIVVVPRTGSEPLNPFSDPKALVPIYDFPVVGGREITLHHSQTSRGFLQLSRKTVSLVIGDRQVDGYLFKPTFARRENVTPTTWVIPKVGSGSMTRLQNHDGIKISAPALGEDELVVIDEVDIVGIGVIGPRQPDRQLKFKDFELPAKLRFSGEPV